MAFKRYAALLAGSALVGSLAFAQPALAQDALAETPKCTIQVVETVQVAKAGTVQTPRNFGQIRSVEVAGIPDAQPLYTQGSRTINFSVPENTKAGAYTVTLTPSRGQSVTQTLTVTLEDKQVTTPKEIDCATIAVDNVTVTKGKTATVDAVVEDGASDLTVIAPEGLAVTVDGNKVTVDATGAEVKTYTVPFTYKADGSENRLNGSFDVTVTAEVVQTIDDITVTEGGEASQELTLAAGVSELKFTETHGLDIKHEGDKLIVIAGEVEVGTYTVNFTYKADGEEKNGSFKVTVKKADAPVDTVVEIDDITVTEGGEASQELTLAAGVSELKFTETHGLDIKHEGDKLIVIAGEVEVGTYTVNFTYKADGTDELQKGSFEVKVVEKDEDEDEEKPKENASSKASSNFLSSFKGSSK